MSPQTPRSIAGWLPVMGLSLTLASVCLSPAQLSGAEPWRRHTIDRLDAPAGADGIRLADANGDGLPDIVTAWEEAGQIRLYVNPGAEAAKQRWPAVTVGRVASPEDAVLVDLDNDGQTDVVSCCEGEERAVHVHWAPADPAERMDASAWQTARFPAVDGRSKWMFAAPAQIDGRAGVDLFVGGKQRDGAIGWLEAPTAPRRVDAWKWHALRPAGWTMSIVATDVDGDGDADALVSDRQGRRRGVVWLENPGVDEVSGEWTEHRLGAGQHEPMFLAWTNLTSDPRSDAIVATRNGELLLFHQPVESSESWTVQRIDNPAGVAWGKAVAVGDVDLDGRLDLVATTNTEGQPDRPSVYWMSYGETPTDRRWTAHDISGPEGRKFDLVELLDIDGDGDLDALTCEERENLGVVWYENPTK